MKRSGFKKKEYKPMKQSGFKRKDPSEVIPMVRSTLRKISKSISSKTKSILWGIFAEYIKWRDNWTCFTCGVRIVGSKMGAGHFIEDSVGGCVLRYNEKNVHAQCEDCNCYKNGNYDVYEVKMVEMYGPGIISFLQGLKGQIIRNYPYYEKIEYYRAKVKELKSSQSEQILEPDIIYTDD